MDSDVAWCADSVKETYNSHLSGSELVVQCTTTPRFVINSVVYYAEAKEKGFHLFDEMVR